MEISDFDLKLKEKDKKDKAAFCKKLGRRLRKIRTGKGISQDQIAIYALLATGTLAKIENGKVSPEIYTLFKISKVLKVSLSELLDI